MRSQEMKDKTIAMRSGKLQMQKDGNYWTEDERSTVRSLFEAGVPVNEIALELERSESAVYQQIYQMGLYVLAPEKKRNRRTAPKEPSCLCAVCSCDCSLCPRCEDYQAIQEE